MTTAQILEKIRDLSVLIVGDIVLDRWCIYEPEASDVSRETGIPRTAVVGVERTPGAGGTVAGNLAAMGVRRVSVLGIIGDDGHGFELRQALLARGIRSDAMVVAEGFQTFTYSKLLNISTGQEDLPRVDFVNLAPPPPEAERQLMRQLETAWPQTDVVIVSDQAETTSGGVVTEPVRNLIASLAARDPGKIVWADSRLRSDEFRNVILKPNQSEAEAACRRLFGAVDYQKLRRHCSSPLLVVTAGGDGAILVHEHGELQAPTRHIRKPVDICGAGDSFSAGAACALAVTGSPLEAARFGNLVASITIMKKGTGTASPEEILQASSRTP